MSVLTLAISCLTTSNLPWFMDLTLQHWTLLLSPVTSTTRYCFCFGSVSSFFLEVFLHSSPVGYWAPTNLGSSSFSVLIFCLFILFMEFSWQEYWSGLPFPSPVDHILSELSIMTHLSWVALHGMAGLCSLWKTRKWILPCFPAFHILRNSMGSFALQLHCSSLCLRYYVVLSVSNLKTLQVPRWLRLLCTIFCQWEGLCSLPVV